MFPGAVMRDYTYEVKITNRKGEEVTIFGPTKSLRGARNVAQKQNDRKMTRIYRDNKLLPGGKNGLDQQMYNRWLEENQPEEDA
jgi:hypothetical protein